MKPKIIAVLFSFLTAGSLASAESSRERVSFNEDWRFARFGELPDGTRRIEPGAAVWSIGVSASSEESGRGNLAPLAMDGDPATYWRADGPDPMQWLELDLGTVRELGAISIQWGAGAGYRFVVEGGNDGRDRVMFADHSVNPTVARTTKVTLFGKARYLRIRITALSTVKWVSISEITLTDAAGQPIENLKRPSPGALESVACDDSAWRKLSVPHDWGIEGPFRIDLAGETGKLPWRGIGWYRKHFIVPASDAKKHIFVDFDGAMAYAKVWLNGEYLGTWPYGYTSFRMELTRHLKFGEENVLAVRLDTEKWDSRWYPGAGLYRNVWLVKTAPVHVGQWGIYVTTPEITDAAGQVKIAVTVDNQTAAPVKPTLHADIYELSTVGEIGRKVVSTSTAALDLAAGTNATATIEGAVDNPRRWDIAAPGRYLARVVVTLGGKVVDEYDTPFGFRTLEFTAHDGFKLNGHRVEIRGTCNHHDLGALGAAVNTRALERQLEILQRMGCNALRTSHNPPAPELLDLADRMGFLVMDEAFDCWAGGKKPADYNRLYAAWHVKDLQALVRRDRNHPSVFIWSIGNEVREQRDLVMTRHLADIMRAEDPTRPVSNGYNDPDGGRDSGAAQALDIMGVNYFFGSQARFDEDPHYTNMPTMGSETSSCISSRGEYFFPITNFRQNWQIASYDLDHPGWACPPDDQFRILDQFPHLLGEFVWTGFDYLGEPTPYSSSDVNLLNFRNDPSRRAELEKELEKMAKSTPPSRSSYFGIIDLAGFSKDRFFSYQSRWRPELPMAHLFPHWTWPERTGQVTPVHVYTSGDEAELFLNGESLGRKRKGRFEYRLRWDDVVYRPGEVKVVAYKDGAQWAAAVMQTTGSATKLKLEADRAKIAADGRDLSFITVSVTDKDGLLVPRSKNQIRFRLEGPGEIVAVDNGDATSFESFQAKERQAYNGLALVIVRAQPGKAGIITLTAEAEGLAAATVRIELATLSR